MSNLLQETIQKLKDWELTPADVLWVGLGDAYMSWHEFAELADFEYFEGYGTAEIHQGLEVVGENWWLERWEYDGSEGWSYKSYPKKPPYEGTLRLCNMTYHLRKDICKGCELYNNKPKKRIMNNPPPCSNKSTELIHGDEVWCCLPHAEQQLQTQEDPYHPIHVKVTPTVYIKMTKLTPERLEALRNKDEA